MRMTLMLLILAAAVSTFAQQRPSLRNRSRRQTPEQQFAAENPSGTNQFGRTFADQQAFEAFAKENPSGKDRFGRDYKESPAFTRDFDVASFLGFSFGEAVTNYTASYNNPHIRRVQLAKPFRMFDAVEFRTTVRGRVAGLFFDKSTQDISNESLTNEVCKLACIFEKQYQVPLSVKRFYDCGPNAFGYSFRNANIEIGVYRRYDPQSGSGGIVLRLEKDALYQIDENIKAAEERQAVESKQKQLDIQEGEGADMLCCTKPNVATNMLVEQSGLSSQAPTRPSLLGGSLRTRRQLRERKAAEEQAKAEAAAAQRDAERQALSEAEKAQREAERAERSQQLNAIQEEQSGKFANLKIESLAGFRFGTIRKDFNFKSCPDLWDDPEVELEKPVRHFVTAKLSYTPMEQKLKGIRLVADARGVSSEEFDREVDEVARILEKKYGVRFYKKLQRLGTCKNLVFSGGNYNISIHRETTCDRRPVLILSVEDRSVKDDLKREWNIPAGQDADRF